MNINLVLVLLCALVILSYLFEVFARWSRIPSALLLIGTGIGIRYFSALTGLHFEVVTHLVHLFGTVGLILIVLESALELELVREKRTVIRNALLSALVILLASAVVVDVFLFPYLDASLRVTLLYAIPLSVISSAIILPSVGHLPEGKREFLIYESSFSDILGIILFNFFAYSVAFTPIAVLIFSGELVVLVLLSVLAAIGLLYLTARITHHIKLYLVIAILVLLFTVGKIVHLPTLILVLIFGLVMNNFHRLPTRHLERWGVTASLGEAVGQLKVLTAETAFLIRTFFFVIFGYSIDLTLLNDLRVFTIGAGVVLGLLFVRYLYLRLVLRSSLFPELFLLPRGLVTIMLYYQIPDHFRVAQFNEGVLFFVIIATNLLMMAGLLVKSERLPDSEFDRGAYCSGQRVTLRPRGDRIRL